MLEYLKGFEKRMEFFAIVESIAKRRNRTDKIENLFEDNQLDNIIMSVLVYIMEITLTEEQECTLESIIQFVKLILPSYNKQVSIQEAEEITRYIIKDILQNKGTVRNYQIMDYEHGNKEIAVRLVCDKINDNGKIIYELTKQGYDFLFRTKEVEDELGFQIEEIKLKMLIKKKNYQGAIKQSKEIIRRLISQKKQFLQFEEKLKSNINEISSAKYEELVKQTNMLLQEEYDEMKQIDELITKSKERLEQEEKQNNELDENIKKAKREVYNISKNVKTALRYQRQILIQVQKLKKLYLQILEDTMSFSKKKRYNLEEEILKPLERMEIKNTEQIYKVYESLANPLFLAGAKKRLNLSLIYDNQSKIKEQQEDFFRQEEELEDNRRQKERIERRNKIHTEMIEDVFNFITQERAEFKFSEWFERLEEENKLKYIEDKRVFLVMLKLYEIETISISEFFKEEAVNETCNGEFDLSYCLYKILKEKGSTFSFDTIKIEKLNDTFKYCIEKDELKETIEMNDLKFTVIGGNEYGTGLENL